MGTKLVCGVRPPVVLCAGVAIAALSMAVPAGAEIPEFKAPPAPVGETTLFAEGGAFWTGGDPVDYGFAPLASFLGLGGFGGLIYGQTFPPCTPGVGLSLGRTGCTGYTTTKDPNVAPDVGGDGALGFDHRFAGTNWHVLGQVRFGYATGSNSSALAVALIAPGEGAFGWNDNTAAALTEWHWLADLGVGYDVITGPSPLEVNFGLRVANVTAKTTTNDTGSMDFECPSACAPLTGILANYAINEVLERSFLGAGPRIGIDGSIPLFGAWTFDYLGDAALLVGNTKISDEATASFGLFATTTAGPPPFSFTASGLSFCPTILSCYWSKWITVVNADMQFGIGYWITPNVKLALSVRLDAFLDALRQFPDDTLPAQSVDRYYWTPALTVTGKF